MKKILITLSVAAATFLIGGFGHSAFAATCPSGEVCGWIDTRDVTAYGVTRPNGNGIGFDYDPATQDQLCKLSGYDHSLAGYNITAKWSKCNNETQVSWQGYWAQRGCNSRTYLTNAYCTKPEPNAAPTISWSKAPSSAACNAAYTVEAAGADVDGNLTAVSVDKEGSPFAYNGGGNGYNEVSGNPTGDSGPQDVTFTAWATDSKGARSATISHTVSIGSCVTTPPNTAPTISWSKAPSSAACNSQYAIEATASDAEGNLATVSVDKDGVPFAYAGGGNGSTGTSGNPTSDTGPKSVTYTAWATDSKGARSGTISQTVSIGSCAPVNRDPSGTFLASCGALSGTASDPDSPGQSIGVHFYVDGPAGSGTFVGATNTDGNSTAYSTSLPDSLKTGTTRTLYAYAINAQGGNNPQIGTATINCAPPVSAPSGFISASPSQFTSSSGGTATISWSVTGVNSCTASGDWSGTKAASGSETKSVSKSSAFSLSCTNSAGTWSNSSSVTVPGNMSITNFFVSPSTVNSGDQFTISAGVLWDGVNYLKRHRAYFQGSQGGVWTYAGGSSASTMTTNGTYTAEQNPYSMYKGPGSYTILYEAEDNAGHSVSASIPFTYQGAVNQCRTTTHTCSASYSGYEYSKSQSTTDLTVYQSCDITEAAYSALKVPPGTATLMNRAYDSQCPQCWADTHGYNGSTWHCDRRLGGYSYSNFQSTFPITYYTSCTISDSEKQALINAGYTYSYVQRTRDASPGEWTDVHTMGTCSSDTTTTVVPTNNNPVTCTDPAADNYGQQGGCSYTYTNNNNTTTGTTDTGGGAVNTGNPGNPGTQSDPGFTITADEDTTKVQFLGDAGAATAIRTLEVNYVNGFNENVTLSVKSIQLKGTTQGLPAGVDALYSFDGKDFAAASEASAVQQFNPSIGGGRYIGELGTIGSTFRLSFSKAVTGSYEVIIRGVSARTGKTAEYVLTVDPTSTRPSFHEI